MALERLGPSDYGRIHDNRNTARVDRLRCGRGPLRGHKNVRSYAPQRSDVRLPGLLDSSAAYRAFRARTLEAAILLVSGTIVMLANAPVGGSIWGGFTPLKDWIFDVPNMSTMRGITIGAALGALALGARTLMGKERGYLRGGGE